MIKDNLIAIRKDRKMTQTALAKAAGISIAYVNKIEKGKYLNPSIELLEKLAKALYCSVEDLTSGDTRKLKEEVFPEKFDNPQEARLFVRRHQVFKSSDFDASKLTDEEIIKFANDVLEMMKLMTYKYKK